ncbi:hypothetical protein ABT030_45875 [Streptomyces mirabilis]|uniref:hypothetical protein n=1 Tax=Streptomyces mirabilis TaxID=68239 RepID=UPI0033311D82
MSAFVVEEGVRESNPVGRGCYTPGRGGGTGPARGLVPRMVKLPWILAEAEWLQVLDTFSAEPIRNRLPEPARAHRTSPVRVQ